MGLEFSEGLRVSSKPAAEAEVAFDGVYGTAEAGALIRTSNLQQTVKARGILAPLN